MDKEKILLDALNTFGNFTSVEQEFNYNQLEVIYEAMNQVLRLFDVSGRNYWLKKDDLEFAIALQEESRLEAVKWLCEKAKGHSLTPLKDAKDILDAYR